ncbi:MAG: gfo/Idh/MocA family oxidoreductase [Crenarchaeota archaeon]|nr:MAG: gfo/Idh/MocA family oxidoreductase [Thermoproteota archaeon]RDJ33314.1 MAG: gfo/Idh/MocA family oxidoreductase [Thermoproteota archaeon]RDJ36183.1 MAG: gfo/Idh/MocA family oxidoreductase [Thermoproteota archaeon]RDJ38814.1 MAG: gfo/Idh/MocA family oxidoreductase [Thermoproteota archaeon]
MKVLIIGLGSIGLRHVRNLLTNTTYKIVIFTKRKYPEFKENKRITLSDSLEKCLQEKPTVAFITNETAYHISLATLLTKNGLDLFIEKPLSNSLDGIKKLQKITKQKKLITQIGCNLRFHKCIKRIKKLITQKKIGKIVSVQCETGSFLPDWHPYEDYRNGYAAKKELGGGVILTMIHDIDYLYWFFGKPIQVFSTSGKFSDLKISVEDYSASIIKFKKNITAELHLDFFQRPEFRSIKIKGTKGIIYWDSETNEIKLFSNQNNKWISVLKLKKFDRNQMYVDEMNHFLKCVKSKKKTINSLSEGIDTLKIALAMKNSAKYGRVIRLAF